MEKDNWDKQNIANLDVTDTAYQNAIKIAQENMDILVKTFQVNENGEFKFYIKVKFVDNEHIEHLWLVSTNYNKDTFTAIVDNVPNRLKSVNYKDTVDIQVKDIEDWIISDKEGNILGNFISHSIEA